MRPEPKKKKRIVKKKKTTIVVGNLPDTCIEEDLRNLFSSYGEVTDCYVNKYGFVHMKTPAQAQTAIAELNNHNLDGSLISVEIAKSKRITGTKPTPKPPSVVFNSDTQKFALQKLVTHLTSRPNIATCLSVDPSYYEYENEFEKFLDFIESLEGLGKLQLSRAIFPLFVHFYLNVIDERTNAETFYSKFVHIFDSSKDYKDVLKELYEIKNRTDIEEHPYFNNFRIKKYILRISPTVLKTLECFLKDIKSKALWQTLSLSFYYEEYDVELLSDIKKSDIRKKARKRKWSHKHCLLKCIQRNKKHFVVRECLAAGRRKKLAAGRRKKLAAGWRKKLAAGWRKKLAAKLRRRRAAKTRKRPAAEHQSVIKKCKSECPTPVENLIPLQMKTNVAEFPPPILRTTIDWLESDIYAMDFNEDATELCIAFGDPCIFITTLEDRHISTLYKKKLQTDIMKSDPELLPKADYESDDEEDISGKKIFFHAPVRVVKYFPNHPHLLLAASGTEIIKMNTAVETITSFGSGHIGEIWDIDINSAGSLFCTASNDMTCRLWDIKKSSVVRIFTGHKNIITTVKFHPNGIYLISGSRDYDIRIWNIENGMCLRCLVDHKAPVILLTCSPDKKTIASADSDGIVKLWNIKENRRISDIICYMDYKYDGSKITSMCFSDDGFLGLCNSRHMLRIWDARCCSQDDFENDKNIKKTEKQMKILKKELEVNTESKIKKVLSKYYIKSDNIPVLIKKGYLNTWSIILRKRGEDMEYYDTEYSNNQKGILEASCSSTPNTL